MNLGPLTFDSPPWLLGLLAVPLVLLVARTGTRLVRGRQHRRATWVRAVAVALLSLALAAPRWESAGRNVDVAFLLDVSDSTGGRASGETMDWLAEALRNRGDGDRAALALFGEDARLEYSLRADPSAEQPAVIINGSATDIGRALRLGQGVLGSKNRRRVIVLTDGRETSGDAVRAARELREAGVSIDVVTLDGATAADVLIEEVRAPGRAREGEVYEVVGILRNTGTRDADVVLVTTADGIEVDRRTVTAAPGLTEVAVERTAESTGTVRYEMRLASGASTTEENDVGRAAVRVDGPPRVLVFAGEDGAGDEVATALESRGIGTDVAEAGAFPSLDRLLDYDSVILADVPASQLGDAGMATLDAYVRDAGHGLVVVGGDDAYGMGQYDATPLEELLPVFARVRDPKRRPSVAEALVVDVSGSMAACHCRADGFGGGVGGEFSETGGVNKTDITKEAIARAVDALSEQDLVGVLAFNSTSNWVIPLQSLPSDAVVDEALARLNPDGETNVVQAVRQAIEGLKDANARLRHIVLFTDGFSENPDMVKVAQEAAAAGITLSVVATGEGTGEVLRAMADAGGGRYYPGRDLFSIPDIIVSEVQFAARPIITEGSFLPIVTGIDAATDDLDSTPPLLGYLATTAKPTARQLLQIGEERDPLLATWQAGLGTVSAWTSDATARWSQLWVDWDGYATFWSDVVKSTFPAQEDASFGVDAVASRDGIQISAVGIGQTVPEGAAATAIVTQPDGTRIEVPLERTGLTTWEGLAPGAAEGVYAVQVVIGDPAAPTFRGITTAIRSYPAEYAATEVDVDFPARLVSAGGGRLDPVAANVFDSTGLEPGSSSREIWAPLALLALIGLVTDVGLRRLRLERGDLGRLLRWLAPWRRRRGGEVEVTEEVSALQRARQAARDRQQAAAGLPTSTGGATSPESSAPDESGAKPPTSPQKPSGSAPSTPQPAGPGAKPPTSGPKPSGSAPSTPPAKPDPDEGGESGVSGLLAARKRAREQQDRD